MADPENSSDEVLSKVGVAGPILAGEAGAGGVVEGGAELIVFVAGCGAGPPGPRQSRDGV